MAIVSDSALKLQEFPLKSLNWVATEDLVKGTEGNELVAAIISTQYNSLNIEETFIDLQQCGKMLQVALTAAGRHKCSTHILQTLSGYQTLCNNSCVTTSSFVNSSVAALKAHKLIIMAFEKGKGELGIKQFEKCGALALEMAKLSMNLESEAEKLAGHAENGLIQASEDSTASDAERKMVLDHIKEAKAKQAFLVASLEGLQEQVEAAEKDEKTYMIKSEEEDQERDRVKVMEVVTTVLSTVATPITVPAKAVARRMGYLKEEVQESPERRSSYRENLAKATEERRKVASLKRDQNAQLQSALSAISTRSVKEHSLQASIQLLQTCVQTLGKIVTTFKNVKMFWQAVATHCQSLVALKDDVKEVWDICGEYEDTVKEAVLQSAVSWAALGKVNYEAHLAMVASKAETDKLMCTLPDGEACSKQVQELTASLLASLDNSNASLALLDEMLDEES